MSAIAHKARYAYESIKHIKQALSSKGVNLSGVPLDKFGEAIENLQTNAGISGVKVSFPVYDTTTNNYYCTRGILPAFTTLRKTEFTFTNDILQVEEES